jgi:uncharacterized protein
MESDAARKRPSVVLFHHRQVVLSLATRLHMKDVRVFGSCVHGTDTPDSDVDLLVTLDEEATVFDLAGFQSEVQELLGIRVDVITDYGDSDAMRRIRAEAVPL